MTRDLPVTDDEIESLRGTMEAQRAEIRADLEAAGVDISPWEKDDQQVRGDDSGE